MNRRILLPAVPAVALLALGLTGCGSDDGSSAADDTRPASSTTTPATPDDTESETPVAPAQPTVDFPEDVDLPEHGGHYWAVVLSPFDTRAEVEQSVEDVKVYGYDAAIGELGCIDGAAQAYDLPSNTIAASLLFATEAKALQFTDAYAQAEDGEQIGVAEVTAYCLD